MAVLYQIYHAKEPPRIPGHLSPDLKDFINCCMKIEPKERWNVYQLLRHPFITGDVFTFHNTGQFMEKNNTEFDNKFFSEEKNTR
jgi:serine/threonine protein kinase